MQDVHRSPRRLQFIPNLFLSGDPGFILCFINMSLKFKSELEFNFISIPIAWSALVVVSRILVQFSLQGKYCNCSTMQMNADSFRLYNLVDLRDWVVKEGSFTSGSCLFSSKGSRAQGVQAFLHSSPLTLKFMSSDPVLLSWQVLPQIRACNNGVFLLAAFLSLSPCPLLLPSPTLEIQNLETARMRSLLCKEWQENWPHSSGLCEAFSQGGDLMLFPHLQLHGDISTLETVLASRSGKSADKAWRRGAIKTRMSSTDFAFLALLYLLTSITCTYKV